MPLPFLAWVGIEALLAIASNYFQKHFSTHDSDPGSIEPPSAEIGRPIPVVWGTCKVQPNVLYFGWARARRYTTDGVFAGYTYHAPLALGICWGPIDRLVDIIFDTTRSLRNDPGVSGIDVSDPPLPRELPLDGLKEELTLNSKFIFGGPEGGQGGLGGNMDFQFGTEEQELNLFLANEVAIPVSEDPGDGFIEFQGRWPRLCYAVFKDDDSIVTPDDEPNLPFYWGTSGSIKPVHFVVARFPSAVNGDYTKEIIASEGYSGANPAEMIYEALTETWWGLKLSPDAIDLPSFQAAAQTLFDEGFGLSMQITDVPVVADIIADILRYIDGTLYTDPITGLLTLALVRADYDPDSLPVFTPANSRELEAARPSYRDLLSNVKVKFTNNTTRNFVDDQAQWTNQATLEASGEEKTETLDYAAVSDPQIATRLAFRDGKALTYPYYRGSFKCDRAGFALRKASPFVLSYPEEGVGPLNARVSAIDYGSLEDGEITVSFVEDVFFVEGDGVGGTVSGVHAPSLQVDRNPAGEPRLLGGPRALEPVVSDGEMIFTDDGDLVMTTSS